MFLTIEGIDNLGKTTICKRLVQNLSREYTIRLVSVPPSIEPWSSLRQVILGRRDITSPARAFALLAARIDSYNRVIKPALRKGQLVLGDRFIDSWFAYQTTSLANHLGGWQRTMELLESINQSCVEAGLVEMPDRTYLLLGNPNVTVKRGRNKKRSVYDEIKIQRSVQRNYVRVATRSARRVELIDARKCTIAELVQIIEGKIRRLVRVA